MLRAVGMHTAEVDAVSYQLQQPDRSRLVPGGFFGQLGADILIDIIAQISDTVNRFRNT